MTEYTATITKISYCGFSAVVDLPDNKKKVIFFQMYRPAGDTKPPDYNNATNKSNEFLNEDTITKEEFISFWKSKDIIQVDGRHKGGVWGLDNCLPSEKSSWLPGLFIGDKIRFKKINFDDPNIVDLITFSKKYKEFDFIEGDLDDYFENIIKKKNNEKNENFTIRKNTEKLKKIKEAYDDFQNIIINKNLFKLNNLFTSENNNPNYIKLNKSITSNKKDIINKNIENKIKLTNIANNCESYLKISYYNQFKYAIRVFSQIQLEQEKKYDKFEFAEIIGFQKKGSSNTSSFEKFEVIKHIYITDKPMPLKANDTILLCKINDKYYIKMLVRGKSITVDMQDKIIIASGEHREETFNNLDPKDENGTRLTDINLKEINIIRNALEQESGDPNKINLAELKNIIVEKNIDKNGIYQFPTDNRINRDPRYSKYVIEKNGSKIYFGYDRKAQSQIYLHYSAFKIQNPDHIEKFIKRLNKITGSNTTETQIKKNGYVDLSEIFIKCPIDNWGWKSHLIFIFYLNNFIKNKLGDTSFEIENYDYIKPYIEENSFIGLRNIGNYKFYSGGSKTKLKKNNYNKTSKHIIISNKKYIIYEGTRKGRYIKKDGKFISIRKLH